MQRVKLILTRTVKPVEFGLDAIKFACNYDPNIICSIFMRNLCMNIILYLSHSLATF